MSKVFKQTGPPTVVVFTGNSNVGMATIKHLVKKHTSAANIRAIVRKMDKAPLFAGMPVEVVNGDIQQKSLLKAVFSKDVNSAVFVTPNLPNRVELTKLFIDACIDHGVDYPIIISALCTDKKQTAYQRQFGEIEAYANAKAGTPVKRQELDTGKQVLQPIILRCAMFYQNIFGSIASIQTGTFYYPLGLHGTMPHVDIDDIGKVVAAILANPEPHANKVYNLIGEYQSGAQMATAMTMNSGKGVKYEHVDDEVALMAFEALGLPEWIASGNAETIAWHRDGNGVDIPSDIKTVTGDNPTRFAEFVRTQLKPLMM